MSREFKRSPAVAAPTASSDGGNNTGPMFVERLWESFYTILRNRRLFTLHALANICSGFQTTFIFYLYPHLICNAKIPSGKVFWLYLLFTAANFIGSSSSHPLNRCMVKSKTLFISSAMSAASLWLLTKWEYHFILVGAFVALGYSTGLTSAVATHSFLFCFPLSNFCLSHAFYFFQAIGALLAVCQFEPNREPKVSCPPMDSHHMHHVIGQERFSIASLVRLDVFCFLIAMLQMPLMYLLQTTPLEPQENENQRDTYEDTDAEPSKLPGLKLVLLAALFACTTTVLLVVFPFLVFSHPEGSIIHCQIFAVSFTLDDSTFQVFFVLGRLISIFTSDKVAPFFFLALCIVGLGAACCAFVFDAVLFVGSALFGLFLAPTLPSLIAYLRFSLLLKLDTLYLLLSGASFGHLLFPLFLCFSAPSENRVLIAFIFFSTVLLVLLYVCMMNVQAQIERTKPTQDRLKMFITRFFSGENLLKRTRSIRPLISRLRPNSYRRFKERRAMRRAETHVATVPKIEITAGSPMVNPESITELES